MINYTSLTAELSNIFDRIYNCHSCNDRYMRISRSDLAMRDTRFFVFTNIASRADFRTKISNYTVYKRFARTERSRRQISRHVAALKKTHLDELRPNIYRLRRPARSARPINMGIAWHIHSPETARLVRMVLLLAFWRGDIAAIRVADARRALSCNRGEAAALVRWIRQNAGGINQRRLRARIFYTSRPYWWMYRRPGAGPGQKNFAQSQDVIPEVRSDQYLKLLKLTSMPPGGTVAVGPPPGDIPGRHISLQRSTCRDMTPGRLDLSPVADILDGLSIARKNRLWPARQPAENHFPLNDYSSVRVQMYGKSVNLESLRSMYRTMSQGARKSFFDGNHDFLNQLSEHQKNFFFSP